MGYEDMPPSHPPAPVVKYWLVRPTEDVVKDVSSRIALEQGCRGTTLYWFSWAKLSNGSWAMVVPADSTYMLSIAERDKLIVEDPAQYIIPPGTVDDAKMKEELIACLYHDVKTWLNGPDNDMDPESRDRYIMWLIDPTASDTKKGMLAEMLRWVDQVWASHYYAAKAKILAGDFTVRFDKSTIPPCPYTFIQVSSTP